MSNTDGERAVNAEEAEAKADLSPSQADSSTSTGSADAESSSDFDETLKSLQKQVATLEKKQQSTKDKALAKTERELLQVKEAVVNLTKLMQSGASSAQVSRGNEEQGAAAKAVQEAFVLAGIADTAEAVENTPEYTSFVASGGGDVSKALSYLSQLKAKRATQVSAAAIGQPPSGNTTPPDASALAQDYIREMNAARGKGFATGDAIKSRFRDLGVPVDTISFSV